VPACQGGIGAQTMRRRQKSLKNRCFSLTLPLSIAL
jgi:hypothetical protein